jgi:hypothetical protein
MTPEPSDLARAEAAVVELRAERDRRIAALVADPAAGTLWNIAMRFGLTASQVHKIAARHDVHRGRVPWPATCSVDDCERRHHSRGLCDAHRQQAERAARRSR